MPVKPKNDPLAARLRTARERMGWTQAKMAQYLLINRSTLSTWEAFGPPAKGPARGFVIIMLKRLLEGNLYRRVKKAKKAAADAERGATAD